MPGEGGKVALYGGATSCYLVRAGNEEIYLDAGSGIAGAIPQVGTNVTLLLTHMHIDHIVGLPFFSALGQKERLIDIYAVPRAGLTVKAAIDRYISPPFWPCLLDDYSAKCVIHELPPTRTEFNVGAVKVVAQEGAHPGGATLFRLTYGNKSLVYATDFEHSPESVAALVDFAANCDLLLYDAQYTDEEYLRYKGYGHSTPQEGIKIARAASAKKLVLVHHAPWRNDDELKDMDKTFGAMGNVSFAKIADNIVV